LWPTPEVNTRRFEALAGSDVRYLSLPLRRDARVSYQLSADLPDLQQADRGTLRLALQAAARPDPLSRTPWLNSRALPRAEQASLVQLGGAPAETWDQPRKDVPRGKVERLGYSSQALANQRQLTLYTPPGYDPEGQRYPLLVLFDEDHYARDVPTPTILDNLIAAGRIRPTLAVIVGNVDASSRGRELPCNEAFADMLAHELLPWLQQRYALSEEPADRVLSGSSYGGLASGCIAYRYPERFGKVLSLSGSFWWGPDEQQPQWLVRQFAAGERLPLTFFLSSGLLEEPEADGILGSNRSLRAALQGKGYPLHYREFPGGHDYCSAVAVLARIWKINDAVEMAPEDAQPIEYQRKLTRRGFGFTQARSSQTGGIASASQHPKYLQALAGRTSEYPTRRRLAQVARLSCAPNRHGTPGSSLRTYHHVLAEGH
ncbi:alpha/beta hydrolase, partial [Pseudomonas aeruginosa]|uniref:alpha/beta hydrolase n=1 Tax=Pseudomonas aeruginosa TaxID=287 RepID=UPI0018728AE4